MLVLLVAAAEPADKPASVHWLQPGKIEEGLARL
jgi:hypothetical protein